MSTQMNDTGNTNQILIDELNYLRKKVSELKDSEAKLKKAEADLKEEAVMRRMLVEQSRDGIVILETSGKVYEANQHYADMLGYTLEETHKLYLWDWQKGFPREALLNMAATVDESGDHFEVQHTRKDGSVFDVEISTSGTICGGRKLILCICRDITERKRNEEQLRESKKLLSTFIDNFRGIAYQVPVSEIQTFKPQLFRGAVEPITGYSCDELTKFKTWNDIIHNDDIEQLQTVRKNFIAFPEYISDAEYRIVRKDGNIRWVKDNAQIVRIGEKDLIFGTIFDITERKTAEEEKIKLEEQVRHSQKLEAIGTLAGGVAHDFNNILGIILGYTDIALKELPAKSKTRDRLVQINKAGNRAKNIIQQLLTFSRKVGTKKQPVDIEPVIMEALIFLRSTLPSIIDIHHEIFINNHTVLADPTQIHQVIMNLCVNAAQAMENRGGMITVTASVEHLKKVSSEPFNNLPEGKYVLVSVSDNGPGINPDIIDRIFDPYFTTRETRRGSGMGLSVVYGIIKNHGGKISVINNPGQGVSFSFVLPVYVCKHKSVHKKSVTATPTGNESVLLVDDEEDITIIGKMMLEDQGFRVTTALSSLEALELVRKSPVSFDVIVTDMTMPNLTGDMLFGKIREICTDVPLILCTGHSENIDEEKALKTGFSAFLFKPFSRRELAGAVRNAIDNYKKTNKV